MSAPARASLEALGLPESCVEVLRHLWDYLDAELSPAGTQRLRAHIDACEQCRGYEGYQTCFLEALARMKAQSEAPAALREKVAERLKQEGCGSWSGVRRERDSR